MRLCSTHSAVLRLQHVSTRRGARPRSATVRIVGRCPASERGSGSVADDDDEALARQLLGSRRAVSQGNGVERALFRLDQRLAAVERHLASVLDALRSRPADDRRDACADAVDRGGNDTDEHDDNDDDDDVSQPFFASFERMRRDDGGDALLASDDAAASDELAAAAVLSTPPASNNSWRKFLSLADEPFSPTLERAVQEFKAAQLETPAAKRNGSSAARRTAPDTPDYTAPFWRE